MLRDLARITDARTGRSSSWDESGRNADRWIIPAGETRTLADITGPGAITHIWMTQQNHYRDCLLRITWDDAAGPSVLVPLGDFFCLGHSIVATFQSLLFSASAQRPNAMDGGCALNSYAYMPFEKRAVVELVNESDEDHLQYFYIDYEQYSSAAVPAAAATGTAATTGDEALGYFHAEFRRTNPFGGWGHEIRVNSPHADVVNKERQAWENNYLILETTGRGHYLGCNLSVTNFQGTWWGEGDDMIWVDGYKWPPDLHGTGSEDYLNQAWGMQDNAFLRNGSSIYEHNTGGYQTSYVFHLENPVRFQNEIKVTIEHGHGNHLANEMSSVAYWYAERPGEAAEPPAVAQRRPVMRDTAGRWLTDESNRIPGKPVPPNEEMASMKKQWAQRNTP